MPLAGPHSRARREKEVFHQYMVKTIDTSGLKRSVVILG